MDNYFNIYFIIIILWLENDRNQDFILFDYFFYLIILLYFISRKLQSRRNQDCKLYMS